MVTSNFMHRNNRVAHFILIRKERPDLPVSLLESTQACGCGRGSTGEVAALQAPHVVLGQALLCLPRGHCTLTSHLAECWVKLLCRLQQALSCSQSLAVPRVLGALHQGNVTKQVPSPQSPVPRSACHSQPPSLLGEKRAVRGGPFPGRWQGSGSQETSFERGRPQPVRARVTEGPLPPPHSPGPRGDSALTPGLGWQPLPDTQLPFLGGIASPPFPLSPPFLPPNFLFPFLFFPPDLCIFFPRIETG